MAFKLSVGGVRGSGFQGALLAAQIALLVAGSQWTVSALAQAADTAEEPTGLSEITVTAQRRSESAQSVPITINVMTAADIQSKGLIDSNSLSGTVPSLNISTQGPQMYTLRGVGTTGTGIGSEQSVALYLDGVYLYDPWASTFPLNSVQRIEVLYGPQGTLFGRNTTGGVIQYISRDPTEDTIQADVGYANYQTTTMQLFAAHKFSDVFAADISMDYRNQGQGWGFDTLQPNEKYDFNDFLSVQTKAVFTPSDATKVTGLFWLTNSKTSGLNTQPMSGMPAIDGITYNLARYQYVANTQDSDHEKSYLGYLRLDQDLGFARFFSLSSFRDVRGDFWLDQDATPITLVNSRLQQPTEAWSQEFQLMSPDSANVLKWATGVYYFNGRASYTPISIAGLGAAPLPEIEFDQTQVTHSGAIFGQFTWQFLEGTNLTFGARYTDETEHQRSHTSSLGEQLFDNPDQATNSSGTTGRVSLNHNFTKDIMAYVSYNRGLKSGGFNLVTATNEPAYKPEHLDAYEIGVKSELFDHRLRLNGAGYVYKFKDIQVQNIVDGLVFTDNAAAATLRGIDMDFEALIAHNFTVTGSLGFLDAHYDSFPNAPFYVPNPHTAAPGGVTCPAAANPAIGGTTLCAFDASGQQTNYAPKWTSTLGGTYRMPTAAGEFTLDAFAKFMAKQFEAPDNEVDIPAHTTANASLSYWTPDTHYGVRLWANNIFDRHYLNGVLEENVSFLQVQGDPRTFGITFSAKY
jgi:iron complex outermembrane receptor protein